MIGQLSAPSTPAVAMGGVGSTVGATTTNLITIAVPLGKKFGIRAVVSGDEPTPANVFFQIAQLAVNRSGTVVLLGSLSSLVAALDIALTGAGVALVISGTNVILQATGVAGKSINWAASLFIEVQQ